ncbi:hypothetical protein CTKZ_04360 [Cellulomonas algicola]|uniref:Uncharacterized protein n=1 Tax=Cellulomonas algicola TaxID=2071633 RepID=A0A401UWB4_9CELL|nr:hypothetical protein CTKZ_04360 [Cellulomonas algicola]
MLTPGGHRCRSGGADLRGAVRADPSSGAADVDRDTADPVEASAFRLADGRDRMDDVHLTSDRT